MTSSHVTTSTCSSYGILQRRSRLCSTCTTQCTLSCWNSPGKVCAFFPLNGKCVPLKHTHTYTHMHTHIHKRACRQHVHYWAWKTRPRPPTRLNCTSLSAFRKVPELGRWKRAAWDNVGPAGGGLRLGCEGKRLQATGHWRRRNAERSGWVQCIWLDMIWTSCTFLLTTTVDSMALWK